MPFVIPVFIPHQGCPHACIFCNQHRISGQGVDTPVTPAEVRETISLWLGRRRDRTADEVQVAFYGGSFTGLPRPRQQELLRAVAPFLDSGQVRSIRLSTRPDYIDNERVAFLRAHGVAIVELGVQSLDDRVLAASGRGHQAAHTCRAVEFLRQGGMEIGMQLMLGLPAQSSRSLMRSVKQTAELKPDFVRIYPVLVLRDSKLHALYEKKQYRPLSLNNAVVKAAWMKKYLTARGIRVVRMGLQPGRELEKSLVAGPYHPAFGEMVGARIMLQQTRKLLRGAGKNRRRILSISDRDASLFRGVHSRNIDRLRELGLADRFALVTDRAQPRFTLRIMEAANNEDVTIQLNVGNDKNHQTVTVQQCPRLR